MTPGEPIYFSEKKKQKQKKKNPKHPLINWKLV